MRREVHNDLTAALLVLGALHLVGCGDAVTATPPVLSETEYTVSFYWSGFDPDGALAGFQWRISDNGEDGIVDVADTLGHVLPWRFTEATDSTFVVTANIEGFPKDVDDSLSSRSTRFWQTHTFFVRAVDEQGAVDPTPAHVSFTATTLAPVVNINLPGVVQSNSCTQAPPGIAFGWDATDPDNLEKTPSAIRYLLKQYGNKTENCLLQVDFEAGAFPIRNDDEAWSDWIRWDAPMDSARIVRFPTRPLSDIGTSYIFAVQAKDIAGAVTPVFEWGRNVRHVRISDTKSPALTVTERFLGTDLFQKTNIVKRFTIASQQVLEFEWIADARNYGNLIEGYRYGFNIVDPEDPDDPGWVVPWGTGPNWRRAAPRVFVQGSPNFIVQARDNSNQITRATYRLQVVQVARRSEQRRLLLVDDHPKEPTVDSSAFYDSKWDASWRKIIQGVGVTGFQSADVIDAVDETQRLTFPLVNDYRGVIWFIGPSGQDRPSFLRSNFAPLDRRTPQFNWLEVYQSFVGNLLIVGSGATQSMIENHNVEFPIVLNAEGNGTLGTVTGPDGEKVNVGTLRYPYTGWCLEVLDMVRPPSQNITGEGEGGLLRGTTCSSITYAGPAPEFFTEYDATPVDAPALFPTHLREWGSMRYFLGVKEFNGVVVTGTDPTEMNTVLFGSEEFYNANVTSRSVIINLRNCQVPMYRAIARRDVDEPTIYNNVLAAGWDELGLEPRTAIVDSVEFPEGSGIWVDNCESQLGRNKQDTSPISLKTIAVASGVFSGRGQDPPTKQFGTLTASDFLWGFNPIQFELSGVTAALRWMIVDHWGVNTDF